MAANPKQPYETAVDEYDQAREALHRLGLAVRDACPTVAELVNSWKESGVMAEELLRIDLEKFVILGRDVSGAEHSDLHLRMSAADVHDLVPLIEALNTPDEWPIGRHVEVKLSREHDEWQACDIVAYSNHFDYKEAAYPIFVQMTLRYRDAD